MNTGLVCYRSHHEKLVIIDYKICYIGGLDLCFGRYDTPEHKVGDCPSVIWPGKDYYNPRYFFSYFLWNSVLYMLQHETFNFLNAVGSILMHLAMSYALQLAVLEPSLLLMSLLF